MTVREGAMSVCDVCGWSPNPKFPHIDCSGTMIPLASIGADKEQFEVRTTSSTGGQKGVKLERHSLIPARPLRLLAEHYGKGAKKYAVHQWREGIEWDKLFDAHQRHTWTFWEGEDYDICPPDRKGCAPWPDDESTIPMAERDYEETCYNHTGSLHLINAVWMLFTLIEEYYTFPQHDNRYIPKDANERDHS